MVEKRQAHPCEYCNLVYYSKSALSKHINEEHWREKEAEEEEDD